MRQGSGSHAHRHMTKEITIRFTPNRTGQSLPGTHGPGFLRADTAGKRRDLPVRRVAEPASVSFRAWIAGGAVLGMFRRHWRIIQTGDGLAGLVPEQGEDNHA